MTAGMKLLIFLYLIIITDGIGAAIAARQSFRISRATTATVVAQWFIAFGTGMALYSVAAFWGVYNGAVNNPSPTTAVSWYLIAAILARLLQTLGIWLIALVLMNGSTPGYVRSVLYWFLNTIYKWQKDHKNAF